MSPGAPSFDTPTPLSYNAARRAHTCFGAYEWGERPICDMAHMAVHPYTRHLSGVGMRRNAVRVMARFGASGTAS